MKFTSPYTGAFIANAITHYRTNGSISATAREFKIQRRTIRKWLLESGALDAPKILPPIDLTTDRPAVPKMGSRIAVISDVQVRPGVDFWYLEYVGRYIASKRPEVVVCIGDFADMPSLSSYDAPGSKGMEGQRYKEDILAVHNAMKILMAPMRAEMQKTGWNPRFVMTLGNHEDRIDRAIKMTPKLDGVIGMPDLEYERWGWEVFPFLQPVIIEGVAFCHYFTTGQMGRPASSARALLTKKHMSCIAGHQQGRDVAYGRRGDGKEMTAIISGSCYLHDEGYLNYQTNCHFRGFYILNDVVDGEFEEFPVTIRHLRRRYEQ